MHNLMLVSLKKLTATTHLMYVKSKKEKTYT